MAFKYRSVFIYTILLVLFAVLCVVYFSKCHCDINCNSTVSSSSSQYVSLEDSQLSHDQEQSLPNVEALDDLLHRTNLDQQKSVVDSADSVPGQTPSDRQDTDSNLPTIFMITPTYSRLTQKADLTRLCQTLMHVQKLEWIIVEDSLHKTQLVLDFLDRCPVSSVHLIEKTSENFSNAPIKTEDGKVYYGVKKPRGIEQRNKAIEWIRQTYQHRTIRGTVYFGDDDNTYDLRLFNEMRYTTKVSVWPVGLAGGLRFEGPKCSKNQVTGWYSYWATDRTFRIDFAGFSISVELLMNSKKVIPVDSKPGYVEDAFLRQFTSIRDLEPRASSCTKVYVWHTRTEKPSMFYENQLQRMGYPSSDSIEV